MQIRTALGEVPFVVEIPDGPMRLAELVPITQRLTELVVGRAVERTALAGQPVSCRAGCAACCRDLVAVSAPEAFHLADVVARAPVEERGDLLARFAAQNAAVDAHGLRDGLEALLAGTSSPEERRAFAARYFSHRIDCAFLRDESCRIHGDRPLTCRDLNVTSPPEWCSDATLGAQRRLPTPSLLSGPLARLAARLGGRPVAFVPLPLSLRFAAEHAELAARTWNGPELFEKFREEMRGGPRP